MNEFGWEDVNSNKIIGIKGLVHKPGNIVTFPNKAIIDNRYLSSIQILLKGPTNLQMLSLLKVSLLSS